MPQTNPLLRMIEANAVPLGMQCFTADHALIEVLGLTGFDWHCCIKAKGVLTAHQSGEAGPSGAVENGNKPGIRTPAAGLLGEQVDQVEQADRLMQQCQNQPSPENLNITDNTVGVARSSQRDPK